MKGLMLIAYLQTTSDSVVFADLEGVYIEVSQKKADNWGRTREKMRGLTDFKLMSIEEAVQARKDSLQVINTGQPIVNCRRKAIRNGETVWYSLSEQPWLDYETDKIIGTISTTRDITEQVLQEEKSLAIFKQVLDMVKIVSHDLSSPLANISMLAKLSMRGNFKENGGCASLELDPLVVDAFTEIYHRTLNLRGAVTDYLHSFSNLTEGQELEKELVDVRELLDEVVEELEDEIRQNNSTIDSSLGEIPYGVVVVRVNRIQLKITYRNHIKNALKHGGENCIISFGYEGWGEGFTLNVFNDGPPVPGEEIQSLFEPFVQGKSVPKGDGLGIGLHIIRNMIRSNGGDMWYETTWSNHPNFKFTVLK
jgi:PAS domain S-box-containing protein